jgi:4-amino-4-deoxy-L-arabinose transferase-like glycosyltransferase
VKLKNDLFLVIFLSALLTLPWVGRAFYSRGEPREALVAQSMVLTGNWISPPAYDGAVPSKPPFSHWLTALVSLPQGEVTESTARLPTAVAVILFSIGFYLFVCRRLSEDKALFSVMILLSFSQWFMTASSCRVDTILSVSLAGGLLALFSWREHKSIWTLLLGIILLTCATLTKGPVGFVLPLAIVGFYLWSEERFVLRAVPRLGALVVAVALPVIALSSLWYVAAYLERGDEFLNKVLYENLDRATSSMHDSPHEHSIPWLLGMFIVGLLPWSPLWLYDAIRNRRWKFTGIAPSQLERFALIAVVFITVVFCIPAGKRAVYLLPAYPFVAILAASSVARWGVQYGRVIDGFTAALKRVALVLGAALCVAFAVRDYAPSLVLPYITEFLRAFSDGLSAFKVLSLAAVALGVWYLLQQRATLSAHCRAALWMVNVVVIVSFCVVDPVMLSLSPKRWLQDSHFVAERGKASSDTPFFSFGSEAYSASFYLKKPFKRALGPLPAGSVVFVEQQNLDRMRSEVAPRFAELGRFHSPFEKEKKTVVVVLVE